MTYNETKSILVTGGSGFIGQALVPALLESGHSVTVLTRNATVARKRLPEATQYIEQLPPANEWPWHLVVNLAGENLFERRWNSRAKKEFRDSRLTITAKIADAIAAGAPVNLLISGSAVGYYGPRDDTKLSENSPAASDFSAQLCIDWETEAMRAANYCNVATVRTGIVLHPSGGALSQLLTPFKWGVGGRLGHGKQWFSWITRSDMVALLIFIIKQHQEGKSVDGAWNATAVAPVTNQRFTKAVGTALGRPTLLPMPKFALRLIMGESADLLVTGQRVIPQRALDAGFEFSQPRIQRALKTLLG